MHHTLEKGVLEIVFDDLKTGNAFDLKKAQALGKLLSAKNISLILLRARGRIFCSGGNLKDYAGLKTKAQGVAVNRQIRAVLDKLSKHPALKIAAVTGDCFGGGIELLSCCDLIYAEPHVFFGMWQRRMALSFGWGGFERLSTRMNPSAAEEWLLTGDVRGVFQARDLGLVDRVMNSARLAAKLSSLKQQCQNDSDGSFAAIANGLKKNEAKVFESLWGKPAHTAHLRRFARV